MGRRSTHFFAGRNYWSSEPSKEPAVTGKKCKATGKNGTAKSFFGRARPLESALHSLWMYPMNRCPSLHSSLISIALAALIVPAGLSVPTLASAQLLDPSATQNEAANGGRNFPPGTLRGSFMVVNSPEIQLDGQPERLSPGARIRSADRMLVMPASITGQKLLVNYTRDAAGLVREVWILTPEEASAKRASAEKPWLNFWPFVADSGPRDDGKTPFDQLK